VAISLDALYSNAAALRSVELVRPVRSSAVDGGIDPVRCPYGFAAQVDGMIERISKSSVATVIATGGLADSSRRTRNTSNTSNRADPPRIAYRS